jgi:glycosyltransferase involved in cell wall biosynthesis
MNILYIVENAVDSGGNRVIAIKIRNDIRDGHIVEVAYILRKLSRFKDLAGLLKDIITCNIKYRHASKVRLIANTVNDSPYDKIISTGRRCLEFLDDLGSDKHCHLIQHIEVWNTLQSKSFFELSRNNGYLDSIETLDIINKNKEPDELSYITRLGKVGSFETVSCYLEKIVNKINSASNVVVCEPPEISFPRIKVGKISNNRDIDVLMFFRNLKFKGDDIIFSLAKEINTMGYKVHLICGKNSENKLKEIGGYSNIFTHFRTSDKDVAELYARSKIVINSSISEGFGAIPREAIDYGCYCISSNTGWVQCSELKGGVRLKIIYRHRVEEYLKTFRDLVKHIK